MGIGMNVKERWLRWSSVAECGAMGGEVELSKGS